MGKLEIYLRPYTVFDPDNRDHRQYYYQFLVTDSWKDCPYRWALTGDEGNLQGQIQRLLLERYLDREFKSRGQSPEISIRQKRKKSVDRS